MWILIYGWQRVASLRCHVDDNEKSGYFRWPNHTFRCVVTFDSRVWRLLYRTSEMSSTNCRCHFFFVRCCYCVGTLYGADWSNEIYISNILSVVIFEVCVRFLSYMMCKHFAARSWRVWVSVFFLFAELRLRLAISSIFMNEPLCAYA